MWCAERARAEEAELAQSGSWPRSSVVKEEEVKRARTRRLHRARSEALGDSAAPFPSLTRTPLLLQAEFNLRQPCKSLRAPDSRFSPEHPRDSPLGGEPRATEREIRPRQLYPMVAVLRGGCQHPELPTGHLG